eukprot:6174450-Pleurochrysis_carterae.AAC.1
MDVLIAFELRQNVRGVGCRRWCTERAICRRRSLQEVGTCRRSRSRARRLQVVHEGQVNGQYNVGVKMAVGCTGIDKWSIASRQVVDRCRAGCLLKDGWLRELLHTVHLLRYREKAVARSARHKPTGDAFDFRKTNSSNLTSSKRTVVSEADDLN